VILTRANYNVDATSTFPNSVHQVPCLGKYTPRGACTLFLTAPFLTGWPVLAIIIFEFDSVYQRLRGARNDKIKRHQDCSCQAPQMPKGGDESGGWKNCSKAVWRDGGAMNERARHNNGWFSISTFPFFYNPEFNRGFSFRGPSLVPGPKKTRMVVEGGGRPTLQLLKNIKEFALW